MSDICPSPQGSPDLESDLPAEFYPNPTTSVSSAAEFKNLSLFADHLLAELQQLTTFHDFRFTHVPSAWASHIFDLLDEIPSRKSSDPLHLTLRVQAMPTEIHNAPQVWLHQAITKWLLQPQELLFSEFDLLYVTTGTTFTFTSGPYVGGRKEPGSAIQIKGDRLPRVVIEVGWSESHVCLLEDMNKLLVGGDGNVAIVVIIKWTRHVADKVSGDLEVYKNDRAGIPKLRQKETIFPAPANRSTQRVEFERGELFGRKLLPGRNRTDLLPLNLDHLREIAQVALANMNLTPL